MEKKVMSKSKAKNISLMSLAEFDDLDLKQQLIDIKRRHKKIDASFEKMVDDLEDLHSDYMFLYDKIRCSIDKVKKEKK